jgi:hypothetical protein
LYLVFEAAKIGKLTVFKKPKFPRDGAETQNLASLQPLNPEMLPLLR